MRWIKLYIFVAFLILGLNAGAVQASPLVNMNVTNAEVRDVLTALASVGQVSIVADDTVAGKITIKLVNIPFDTALELVTKTKGLIYQKIGSVIVVGSGERISRGFGSIHVIKLNYAKAADVAGTLALALYDSRQKGEAGQGKGSDLLASGRLKVDEATNSVIFLGSPAEAEQVKQILAQIDIPYQQVSLEAQVVAINKSAAKDLGIEWEWEKTPQYAERDSNNGSVTVTREKPAGIIQFGRNPEGYPYEFYYQAKINALISGGNAKILAKPKITAINGKEARILIGDRVPVLVDKLENGKSTTTIEYIDAGIKLTYTPWVNADGQITALVHTEVSTPTLVPEMKAYRITTREASTNVRVKDGETMVIGGLISSEESGSRTKVPGLGDLPVLGKLFQSVHKSKSETEVVIFLTATIVK